MYRLYPGWWVFKGGTWATPKPYMPRTMCSFQLQMPEGVPLTSSSLWSWNKNQNVALDQMKAATMGLNMLDYAIFIPSFFKDKYLHVIV